MVVSPATVEWAEFELVETVVGQAHSNCLRLPREAWYEIGGEPPATVGLSLCFQLFILSLMTLSSLRWSNAL